MIEAATDQDTLDVGMEVTVAIRPEKITLVPEEGVSESESVNVATTEIMSTIEHERNKTLIPGEVTFANYIGTDTRYIVRIGQKTEVVVRIQNFGTRYDTIYKIGQHVQVYWATENARVLLQ